ncbi:MAG: BlaI/MecI/CopY family transcriptional regulator [Eubacteriales bacterium]
MSEYRLGEVEMRFADIIWQNEPLQTRELVALASENLSWSKSTTYTILGRLSDKGIFKKDGKTVTSLISKEELVACQSEKFVEDTFSGSLPKFLASFSLKKKLSNKEIDEIQAFIDKHREV